MRWSSSYTRAASRSNAVWSPPLQALNKPVISADRGSIAIPKMKISRPWPVFPSTSARSGGGGTGNEDHTLGCHVGNGGSEPFCWTKRGAAKGDCERLYGNRPVHPDGCPAVGFGDVREHRCENRLARAGFMPGRGRRHPGAPVPRLELPHARDPDRQGDQGRRQHGEQPPARRTAASLRTSFDDVAAWR